MKRDNARKRCSGFSGLGMEQVFLILMWSQFIMSIFAVLNCGPMLGTEGAAAWCSMCESGGWENYAAMSRYMLHCSPCASTECTSRCPPFSSLPFLVTRKWFINPKLRFSARLALWIVSSWRLCVCMKYIKYILIVIFQSSRTQLWKRSLQIIF